MLQWRDIADCPPSSLMIASPYDVDSRYSEKRGQHRGLQKTPLHHIATVAAINLQRFVEWMGKILKSKAYQSHFAKLSIAA